VLWVKFAAQHRAHTRKKKNMASNFSSKHFPICPNTQAFYELIDPQCRQAPGRLSGDVTHTCMEGVQRIDRGGGTIETLHSGVLSIPIEHHDLFKHNVAKTVISGAKLHLSECRTNVFPKYFEIDLDVPHEPHTMRFLLDVIDKGVPRELTEDPRLEVYAKFPAKPPFLANDRVNAKLSKTPSWWELLSAIRDVCIEYNEAPLLDPQVARFMCLFVHVAFARVIQKVVRSFYPRAYEDNAGQLLVSILVNKGPLVYESPPLDPKTGMRVYKMGAHYYMAGTIVSNTQSMWIDASVVLALKEAFPGRPMEFWNKLVDRTDCVRMPFSYKAVSCKFCVKGKHCMHCQGVRKTSGDRCYAPGIQVIGSGNLYPQDKQWVKFYRVPAHVLALCTVRTPAVAAQPGFEIPKGAPEPVLKQDPFRQLVSSVGLSLAEKKRKQVCEELQVDVEDPRVNKTLRIHNQWLAFDRGETASTRCRVELIPGDPRRDALDRTLPQLLGKLHQRFDAPLDGACLVYEAGADSAPSHIDAYPVRKSSADGWCFNRMPERGTGPGLHSCKRTYFRVTREGARTGLAETTQKCGNPNDKATNRTFQVPCSAPRSAKRKRSEAAPVAWSGKTVTVTNDEKTMQALRDMFFLPKDQTCEKAEALATVEVASGRIAKKFPGGIPIAPMCGPHPLYNHYLSSKRGESAEKQEEIYSHAGAAGAAGAAEEGDNVFRTDDFFVY
jgi:hypothetical protein